MLKRIFLLFIVVLVGITGCQKVVESLLENELPVNDLATVTASINGTVINENNVPVQGATVSVSGQTASTDANGFFQFKSISMSRENAWVKVTKSGYFNGNRTFKATAGRNHSVRIKLLSNASAGTFDAATGGNITLSSGAKITFPAAAITDAGGAAYTGQVTVAMKWLDPTSGDLPSQIPGDLRGINSIGVERALKTFGMIGAELRGAAGQTLKIASGKKASLSFPLPASIATNAPATIPLWHFSETLGRWVEEGEASKVGNNYVGEVSHFSFWNCDAYFPLINLCVQVTNTAGAPLSQVQVRIKTVNDSALSVGYGITDSLGNVCGGVPKNEALVIEILDFCGSVIASQNVGPYAANASVSMSATIPSSNFTTITGTIVNCSNTPITTGAYAYISLSNGYNYVRYVNASGAFTASILNCSASITYSIIAVDSATQQQGAIVTGALVNGSTNNVGNLSACGNSAVQFANLVINGVTTAFSFPADSLNFSSGATSGNSNITGMKITTPGSIGSQFSMNMSTITGVGSVALNNGYIVDNGSTSQQSFTGATANITEFGAPVSGFVAGTLTQNFIFNPGAVSKTVTLNFRIRRD